MTVEILHDRVFAAVVCCDIDPATPECFDRLDEELQAVYNGTLSIPWRALRPADKRSSNPVKCQDHWHYVVVL